ncbi:MAG: HipA N-terminal domain-containing protein [Ignavibacteriaceae bacterium]|nr:HipA N-terminal domain-containing protein [Ignavibacteriaceae bacterium]
MKRARVYNFGIHCGYLDEIIRGKEYVFTYRDGYDGKPISLTMPVSRKMYRYEQFPPFFDGLLPEGFNLDALCRRMKIDRDDSFRQLMIVGKDVVGSVSVEPEDE